MQVEGRATDDLQHFRSRGLLLQGLRDFARARLHLVKQPHVVDRDHRLISEGGDEVDLLFREGFDFPALQGDDADRSAFAQQRNAEKRAKLTDRLGIKARVFRIGERVVNLDRPAFEHRSPANGAPVGCDRLLVDNCEHFLRMAGDCGDVIEFVLAKRAHDRRIGVAQPHRGLDDRLEDWLRLRRCAADYV